MGAERSDRFHRADYGSRRSASAAEAPTAPPLLRPADSASDRATQAPTPPTAPAATPSTTAQAAKAGPWRRSELRPDDQILDIVDVESQPAAPLRDDARTGYVLRDGNSNRVLLIDTGPVPAAQVAAGTAAPSVQGSPVALVQGTALPLVLGRALPLVQGTVIPQGPEASPLGLLGQVIASPALRDMTVRSLASEVSGDSAQQETRDGLSGSLLGGLGSS